MRRVNLIGVLAVLLVLGAAAWLLLAGRPAADRAAPAQPGPAEAPASPVEVAQVRTGTVAETVEAVGTARADESVVVTAKVTGKVRDIRFEEGATVAAGDVLVELDTGEQQAELAEARAELVEARRAYTRARRLAESDIVARGEVEDLRSRLEAARARVEAAAARLADLRIVAPFGGRIGLREVSPGALVTPGTPITTLDDIDPIAIRFSVPETVLPRLRPGLPVVARAPAYGERTFEGRVTTLDTRVDPVTRAIAVEAEFPNPDGLLRPGVFASVELTLERREHALLIPEQALVLQGDRAFVFVVRDGRAIRQAVTPGKRLRGSVEIVSGLEAGERVIVEGLQKVQDGAPVSPRPAGQAG